MLITPFYAALFGIGLIWLSARVIGLRKGAKVSLGDGDNETLRRRVRAHANFAEYVPLGLLLIYFVEMSWTQPLLTHALALTLLVGRAIHAYAVGGPRMNFKLRVRGMVLTFLSLGVACAALLACYVIYALKAL
jgi:uncharacterized protein